MWKVQENSLPDLENSFSKTIERHYIVWLNKSSFLTKKKRQGSQNSRLAIVACTQILI